MASSSSSSFQSWNHDVFLSFRGTDTRKTFVDHLYSALVQQGIYTYKDDETLPRGETISPSLLKAIEESRIAVIVLSENYADSSWCLQELSHIMKCKDERGQIVMPIFYHMDPSEVRKQKRKYGEAFAKHESENESVESWRKALVDVGNISGWEAKHITNGHEAKCIKEIVGTISNRLCAAISSDNEDLIGIAGRLQDLKSKLEMESDGVMMVGIWGIGGGGKTTLASSLYNEISSRFDGCCFVENIREESSKHGLPKFQNEILSLVLKQKEIEVNRVEEGRRLLKSRFCRKKVLIVLDDVDHLDQLKVLAGSHDWFGEGSRIIITTRDKHLLNAHRVNVIYNISLLNEDEAMKLFCKHCRPIDGYEMLSKYVVFYAGGLPLALKVLGSFLCDKDMSEWRSALARLKDVPDNDIVEKLKISYNGLKPMEKELFLDIACFFNRRPKDSAMEILDACGFHPIIGVKVLIQKALITVSQVGWFDMHDLLLEMGRYIVRGENPKNPEKHSRVWKWKDIVNICAMDAMTKNDRIEALQVEWQPDMLPRIFPQVVANMKKLRWISCFDYPAISLPRNFQPMKLCCLELKMSRLEQLWKGYKHLPNLKVLDLDGSKNLISTPDFDGLPCLERMILKHCRKLTDIHPSIGYHDRLTFLDMEACGSLKMFPPIIRMKKLETFILSYCFKLCMFPEIQTSLDSLVELNLRGTGIVTLPSSIGRYCTNLRYLDLTDCRYLQSIEGNFHRLKFLKGLYLEGCDQLKNIPVEGLYDVKCCLEVLSLSFISFKNPMNYTGLEENFRQGVVSMKLLGFSRFLRRLTLRACNLVDGNISSVFCELSHLQVLDLSRNYFSRLHASLSQLPRLKYLDLSGCSDLVELPDLPSSISILKADVCDSLEIVGDLPTNYKWLWKFSLPAGTMLSGTGERVLHSMLQGNAIEHHFISIHFDGTNISTRNFARKTHMLKLPGNMLQLAGNWCNDFSGFLIYVVHDKHVNSEHLIIIKDITEDDVLEDFDETVKIDEDEESETAGSICYISFGSLRHTSWWNSTHNMISFSIKDVDLKVEPVLQGSKDDSTERAKCSTNCTEFWDEEGGDRKTFEIKHDSKSSIEISWCHHHYHNMFHLN